MSDHINPVKPEARMGSFAPIETITFEAAKEILRQHRLPKEVEECRLEDALGRVLSFPIESKCDLPQFDNSAVDGFAICEEDRRLLERGTLTLEVVGTLEAGHRGALLRLRPGTTVYVLTGAPVPPHTAAVAMQEDTAWMDGRVALSSPLTPQKNVRFRGEECLLGSWLFEAGTCVTPAMVGALAAAGCETVEVFCAPKIGVLTTGSEIIRSGTERAPFQTYDANGPSLVAALHTFGIADVRHLHAIDDTASISEALHDLLADRDLILCVGGVSVGERDVVRPTLAAAGVKTLIQGVAIRPGKPFFLGQKGLQIVFGLPGNPLSALISYLVFVLPYLRQAMGSPGCATCCSRRAKLSGDLKSKRGLRHFIPGTLIDGGFEPATNRCSSMLTGLGTANALAIVPEELGEAKAGDEIDVLPIRWQACNL